MHSIKWPSRFYSVKIQGYKATFLHDNSHFLKVDASTRHDYAPSLTVVAHGRSPVQVSESSYQQPTPHFAVVYNSPPCLAVDLNKPAPRYRSGSSPAEPLLRRDDPGSKVFCHWGNNTQLPYGLPNFPVPSRLSAVTTKARKHWLNVLIYNPFANTPRDLFSASGIALALLH